MYKKYFDEYYVSDEELKQMIYRIIDDLTVFAPDDFNSDILNYIGVELDTATLLQNLIAFVPTISQQKKNFEVLTENQSLRVTAILLDMYLYVKRLEYLLLKLVHMVFAPQLLGLRYVAATEIIEKQLGEELKYDPDLLFQNLMNPYKNSEQERASILEAILAEEEIERVCSNEGVRDFFWDTVDKFETSVEDYIKKGLPHIVHEMFGRIFFEGMLSNANILANSFGEEAIFTSHERKELIKEILKQVRQGTNYRLGIKHGGVRERDGFIWTKERKIEFYTMVEGIPKINRKKNGKQETTYIWEYIYEQFDSRGQVAKELLTSEPGYELIPPELLDEAFRKWQVYEETYTNIKAEDTPKMFMFRQALDLLNFPPEHFNKRENRAIPYKKATLQKYYDTGKELIADSDNQVST